MAGFTQYRNLLVVIAAATFLAAVGADASSIGFNFHHRHSKVVRRWAEARGHAPEEAHEGSPEYYSALSHQDRTLFARRGLASQSTLTFADGNVTTRLDGYLHYAEVEVGTPSTKFLVALDTGSHLFWVPCECKQCAPTGSKADRPYSPRQSSTSKTVTCANDLCDFRDACIASNSTSCSYEVKYGGVFPYTSSSGVLVEDVLYLTREKQSVGEAVQANVVFGCGQEQTGDFMNGAAPDGLMGLGMDKVSVPSALASNGLVASDSFSMCFSLDGVGRINFGDAGSQDQAETPFSTDPTYYNISVTAVSVESKALPVEFTAVVDSGTSYTYLSDPAYTFLTTNFNSRVSEKRTTFPTLTGSVTFEYCYSVSPDKTEVSIPVVSLTTKGGALFPITRPIVTIYNIYDQPLGYCLAVIKNGISESSMDTIGQNFMTGLKVVFNRERSVLGWEEFDCYKDIKMQDNRGPDSQAGIRGYDWVSPDSSSGIPDSAPLSPDSSPGIPDSAPLSPDSSPGPVATPFMPSPWQNNSTSGMIPDMVPLHRPASSSDGIASSNRRAFGGLPLMLLPVLAIVAMA